MGRLKDFTPEEVIDFFLTVCKCQRMLEEYYQTTSATITVQDGEFAGQTVKVKQEHRIYEEIFFFSQLIFLLKLL